MAVFIRAEDLASEEDPNRSLWGRVLLMAIRDEASSVHYHPWRGDGALSYIIANTRYDLLPPPADWAWQCASPPGLFWFAAAVFLAGFLPARRGVRPADRLCCAWRSTRSSGMWSVGRPASGSGLSFSG